MSAQLFEFEGTMMSVAEVKAFVPRFSETTIRGYLKAGATTRAELMQRAEQAMRNRVIGGKRGAKKSNGKWGA